MFRKVDRPAVVATKSSVCILFEISGHDVCLIVIWLYGCATLVRCGRAKFPSVSIPDEGKNDDGGMSGPSI